MFIIIESFVSVIVAIIVGVLFITWEIRLAKDDVFWKGLIPIGVAVLFIGLAAMLTMYFAGNQKIEYLSADLAQGMEAEMAVKILNGKIIAYGPIEIIDGDGTLIDRCSVSMADLEDKEMADIRLPRYKDVFIEMTEGRTVVARFNSDKEEILDKSLLIIPDGGAQVYISTRDMWESMLYLCVPMLVIYLMKRRQLQQEQIRREMKKMSVENLG